MSRSPKAKTKTTTMVPSMVPWIVVVRPIILFLPPIMVQTSNTTNGITVGCANGSTMQSKATDCLALCNLPPTARTCHKFYEAHLPLLSVPKLCVYGCKVQFGPTTVNVTNNEQFVLTGTKDPTRNLYTVPLHDTVKEHPR